MENLFSSALSRPKTTIKSERADVIRQLMEGINACRKHTKYPPITPRAVAIKVGHIKELSDLYYLLSICKQAKSFSACFFGSLKVKMLDN